MPPRRSGGDFIDILSSAATISGVRPPKVRTGGALGRALALAGARTLLQASGIPADRGSYAGHPETTGGGNALPRGCGRGSTVLQRVSNHFPQPGRLIEFAVGRQPGVGGDLAGDGDADLATSNRYGNNVSVLMNNGDGTFMSPRNFDAGETADFIEAADFNRDGHLGLAVSNVAPYEASILLNNGDATFQSPISFSVGGRPRAVAPADFNGDGRLDLAVANEYPSPGGVSLLMVRPLGTA